MCMKAKGLLALGAGVGRGSCLTGAAAATSLDAVILRCLSRVLVLKDLGLGVPEFLSIDSRRYERRLG